MKGIDKEKVALKKAIGFSTVPDITDLLYEIVCFIETSGRKDEYISYAEICNKTKTRIHENVDEDIEELMELGFLDSPKAKRYMVPKHPWE